MPAYASCVGQQFPALGIPVLELTPTLRAGLTCRFEESHCFCLRETARDLQTEDVYIRVWLHGASTHTVARAQFSRN